MSALACNLLFSGTLSCISCVKSDIQIKIIIIIIVIVIVIVIMELMLLLLLLLFASDAVLGNILFFSNNHESYFGL